MTSILAIADDEVLDPFVAETRYRQALELCEGRCQDFGGIRDGQIREILADFSELTERTRVIYYWQLRLLFPNPYE